MGKKSIFDFTFANRRRIAQDSDTAVRDKVLDVAGDVVFAVKVIDRCKIPGFDTPKHIAKRDEFVEKAINGIQFVLGMDYGLAIDEEDFKEYVAHLRNVGEGLEKARHSGFKDCSNCIHLIDPVVYFKLDRKHFGDVRKMCGLPNEVDELFGPIQKQNEKPADPPKTKKKKDLIPIFGYVGKGAGK